MHGSGRDLRVGDFVRDELANIILFEMRDPRIGMISVNEARVSRDLAWADVYVSSHETADEDSRAELVEILNKAAGYLRSELAKRHSMRTTPKLRFHYDETVERGPAMEKLIGAALDADARQHRDAEDNQAMGDGSNG